jgi:hypothetical protein
MKDRQFPQFLNLYYVLRFLGNFSLLAIHIQYLRRDLFRDYYIELGLLHIEFVGSTRKVLINKFI